MYNNIIIINIVHLHNMTQPFTRYTPISNKKLIFYMNNHHTFITQLLQLIEDEGFGKCKNWSTGRQTWKWSRGSSYVHMCVR